jgi:hypothetical protein
MAFKPEERASIEAQVILKGAVEITSAQISSGSVDPNEDIYDTLDLTAKVLVNILTDTKKGLGVAVETVAAETIAAVFPGATTEPVANTQAASFKGGKSSYIDDSEYALVHKLWLAERATGVDYGSKDSMFMDNQAIRKLFQSGKREFPEDYWAEKMRGQTIPVTKNGKCALGDFKIKKGVSVDGDGNAFLAQGEGNHPLAGMSGYFGGLVNNSPFNWGERPDPLDPHNWLSGV